MKTRICICCGEPIAEGNDMSRNPNVCASCSSLADGMEEKGTEQVTDSCGQNTPTSSESPGAREETTEPFARKL